MTMASALTVYQVSHCFCSGLSGRELDGSLVESTSCVARTSPCRRSSCACSARRCGRRIGRHTGDGVASLGGVGVEPGVDDLSLGDGEQEQVLVLPPREFLDYRSIGSGALAATRWWSRISCQNSSGIVVFSAA
jgi:hypothetical protein